MNAQPKKVRFGNVVLREYEMTLGDNPAVSLGPPVCLGDKFLDADPLPMEDFEKTRAGKRRQPQSHRLKLNYYQRYDILHQAGFDDKGIKAAEKGVSRTRLGRKASYYYCYPYIYVGKVRAQLGRQRNRRLLRTKTDAIMAS